MGRRSTRRTLAKGGTGDKLGARPAVDGRAGGWQDRRIRGPGGARHDQARAVTPAAALGAGADYLVIGRAVTAAGDPLAAWRALWTEEGT